MRINVVGVEPKVAPKGYEYLEVSYSVDGGPGKTSRVMGFGDGKQVFDTLKKASHGQLFDIELKKNGQYFNWVKATEVDSSSAPATKPTTTTRSTYETPEERSQRQLYIIRQSSIANSIEYLSGNGASSTDVLRIADIFVKYVMTGEIPDNVESSQVKPAKVSAKKAKATETKETAGTEDPIESDFPWDEE